MDEAARRRLAAALDGLGNAGAAELVGCTPQMLGQLARGTTTRVSRSLADKIQRALGVRL